jgi:hypothetical protein
MKLCKYLGRIRLDDPYVLWSLWPLQMHFLLVRPDDPQLVALEDVVDQVQELGDIS